MQRRSLLVSDLDGTLLGDDAALAAFAAWHDKHGKWLSLVYASGRLCDSMAAAIESSALPRPRAVIGGVGTEIEMWPSRSRSSAWEAAICRDWDADEVRRVLASHSQLEAQPEEFQSTLKASYYLHQAGPAELTALRAQLAEAAIGAEIIYSSDRDLDIIPKGTNKGSAAAFLAAQWGFGRAEVMVAGDTENDLALFEQQFLGIVPANAQPELRLLADARVYHSSRSYAAGVLDGIRHWTAAGLT